MENPESRIPNPEFRRFDDWPELLAQFIADRASAPFAWGKNDCALFVCDAILVMTGRDLAAPFRGKYDSQRGAARAMRKYLGISKNKNSKPALELIAETIARANGLEEIPPAFARRGDAILFDGGEHWALGVVGMNGEILGTGELGLLQLPISAGLRAWRI